MCNQYRAEIIRMGLENEAFGFEEISEGPRDIYPDVFAPVIRRDGEGHRRWDRLRWGFPPPPQGASALVTNARNLASPFWRPWLKPEYRCLAPFSAFCEWTDARPKRRVWFEMAEGEGPAMFAGVWRPWTGVRGPKANPDMGEHHVFAILTCAPDALIAPIHAKAMPVILADRAAQTAWLEAPATAVEAFAAPLAEARLAIVEG